MDTPKPGENFQVGSNYSSQTRKVAEVVRTEVDPLTHQQVTVVKDELGYEQKLLSNNNASPASPWFSK